MSPMFPSGEMAIEVFELAENEDTLSPVEMDPEKLVHKFKEVRRGRGCQGSVPAHGSVSARPGLCLPRVNARLLLQLQIKHAVTEAEIQQLKRKVSGCGRPGSLRAGGTPLRLPGPPCSSISPIPSPLLAAPPRPRTVLCAAMQCHACSLAMPCRAAPRRAVPCHAVLHRTVPCHAVPCH